VRIRVVHPKDLPQLRILCDEQAALEGAVIAVHDLSAKWESAFFGKSPALFGWVCDEERDCPDSLLGYMTASIRLSTWSVKPHLYLDCIYLRPALRRSGVGRGMFEVLTEFARDRGCKEIQWHTLLSNDDGIAFYRSLGALSTVRWSRWSLPVEESRISAESAAKEPQSTAL
jgi:GNAT superfamily N-acetyltransferase